MQRKFDPAAEQWLDYREVCALAQVQKTTLYQKVKDGAFPAPVVFSARKRRWALSWVQEHLDSLVQDAERHNARLRARRTRRSA